MNALLKKLTELEFYAVDLLLYIDTHPNCTHAIGEYNKTVKELSFVGAEYEKNHGPLFNFVSFLNDEKSDWINQPWPWEYEFYAEGNN